MDVQKTVKKISIGGIVVASLMLILGIVIIVWPDISALTVCTAIGAVCLVAGIFLLIRYFSMGTAGIFFRLSLWFGILLTICGIVLIVNPYPLLALLPIIAGVYIIITGAFSIQVGMELRRIAIGNWLYSLLIGALGMILGVLLILNPFEGVKLMMTFLGISLVIDSIEAFYAMYCVSRIIKSGKSKINFY